MLLGLLKMKVAKVASATKKGTDMFNISAIVLTTAALRINETSCFLMMFTASSNAGSQAYSLTT